MIKLGPARARGVGIGQARGDRVFSAISTCLLIGLLLAVAYPLWFVVIASVSDSFALNRGEVILWPKGFQLVAYQKVFASRNVLTGFRNTVAYTVVGTALNLILTMTAGYALSVKKLFGRRTLMLMITFTMFFSGGMIPSYFLMRSLNILNKFWVMVLPGAVSAYNLMIARTFLRANIPEELREAAEIDGCGHIRFFARVVAPLSGVLISILALFYAVGHWNSYFNALMYITDRSKFPLQIILREILLQNSFTADEVSDPEVMEAMQNIAELLKYALIIVSSLPVLLLYPFLQRNFVKGVMIGSVKG